MVVPREWLSNSLEDILLSPFSLAQIVSTLLQVLFVRHPSAPNIVFYSLTYPLQINAGFVSYRPYQQHDILKVFQDFGLEIGLCSFDVSYIDGFFHLTRLSCLKTDSGLSNLVGVSSIQFMTV